MEVLGFFFFWFIFVHVFAAVVRALFIGTGHLIAFVFFCLVTVLQAAFTALVAALRFTGRAALAAARAAGRGAYLGAVFAFYLADEWLRGPPAGEPGEEWDDGDAGADEEEAEERAHYAAALAHFGLAPGFTAADLSRAYKRIIRKAHPDAGGSLEEAQAVNAARDLIARAHGWQ